MGSPGNFTIGVTASDRVVNYATKKGTRNADKFEGQKLIREVKISREVNILDYGTIKDWNPTVIYRGTFYDSLIHEKTARLTVSSIQLWQDSWNALEHDYTSLPEDNDNTKILSAIKNEWKQTRNTFRYFPNEVTGCTCENYHANISAMSPRNEDTRGTEHEAIVI